MHRTFSVKRTDDNTTLVQFTAVLRYTNMFAFHVALNKITQPEASSVIMIVLE